MAPPSPSSAHLSAHPPRPWPAALAAPALLCALALPACKRTAGPAEAPAHDHAAHAQQVGKHPDEAPGRAEALAASAADAAAHDRYTVRGIVRGRPADARPGSDRPITILHQAIPEFRDRDGEVTGMMAMAMPFLVGAELDPAALDGLAVGDKIEFTFEVDWAAALPTRVVALTKLPADTELKFGR